VIANKTVNQKFGFDYGVRSVIGKKKFTYIALFILRANYIYLHSFAKLITLKILDYFGMI
jgi:hypothetical protein